MTAQGPLGIPEFLNLKEVAVRVSEENVVNVVSERRLRGERGEEANPGYYKSEADGGSQET